LENHAPGIRGNAAPSFEGDSVGRKLIGSDPHSKCFFCSDLFTRTAIQACNLGLQCCAS
jgi:hypothetical protein